jgi:predicted dehydrogenase
MKLLLTLAAVGIILPLAAAEPAAPVRLMTLDPGHFHAALVQKFMLDGVDPVVNVYAPEGPDLAMHVKRIEGFNARPENPTRWVLKVHTGPDSMKRMLAEKPGNVVVLAGNNARKTESILQSVKSGLNVLSDKPMAINPRNFELLREAFEEAGRRGVLLYDIMTERFEIASQLQRELAHNAVLFGELEKGTPGEPAVTKESVHYFYKTVAGAPLKRPEWFFDVTQQGEGIVDVTTHLVDLIQWACFPEQALDWRKDSEVLTARRWATPISAEAFERCTGAKEFPAALRANVDTNGTLQVFANGEFTYRLKGVHAKVVVDWRVGGAEGGKDTHFSLMRGSKARLIIRQGEATGYKATLFIEPADPANAGFEDALKAAVAGLQAKFPGVGYERADNAWKLTVPDQYHNGHEAHFAQVTEKYIGYLKAGALPSWEVPNMLTKYATIMQAYEKSR